LADKLNLLDTFPEVTLTTVEDAQIHLPRDIGTDYAVVLFYRGHW